VASTPVFINARDRLTTLAELVTWLERAGVQEIYMLDNDSAYEPLLEYYEQTPHTVIRLGTNVGKFALWATPGVFERTGGRRFVYTDPDVVPSPECPLDALDHFDELLSRYPRVNKVGFGLRIDDLPDHYRHKETVVGWEQVMWEWPVERGVYYAPIDTTFALYREGGGRAREALRTGFPYIARHESWYLDFDNLTPEEAFYQSRAVESTKDSPGTSHWGSSELPQSFLDTVARVSSRRQSRRERIDTWLRWRLRGRRLLRKPASD
jgi:hypothetical protein